MESNKNLLGNENNFSSLLDASSRSNPDHMVIGDETVSLDDDSLSVNGHSRLSRWTDIRALVCAPFAGGYKLRSGHELCGTREHDFIRGYQEVALPQSMKTAAVFLKG